MAKIELIDVCKTLRTRDFKLFRPQRGYGTGRETYPPFAINHINLEIEDGKTTVVLGPSGCGKTTLLKIIAGLIPIDSGTILFNEVDMKEVLPGSRKIGMVFQDYALYPHLDSKTNILSYFLFKRKTTELYEMAKEKFDRTSELMGVDIKYLLDRMPHTLSGGEKQRVAIGRCITRDPHVFLLDEPFLNLDQMLKDKYRVNLKHLLRQFDVTSVYVTHDQQEALIFADRIAIMNNGMIEQVGTYEDIYNNPVNIFVASFLNSSIHTPAINLINGKYISDAYDNVTVGVRPEDITISDEMKPHCIKTVISEINTIPLLKNTVAAASIDDATIHLELSRKKEITTGSTAWLYFEKYHTFDNDTGKRIQSYSGMNGTIIS